MIKNVFAVLLFISTMCVVGQDKNLFSIDFGVLPSNNENVSLKTTEAKLNIPVKLKKGILENRFSFSNYNVGYENGQPLSTSEIENFKSFSYSLSYLKRMKNNWSYMLNFSPVVTSNFESGLAVDALIFNGALAFSKSTGSSRFKFGVVVNSGFGVAIPIPIISYSKQVNEQFSYEVGIPVMKAKYQFNKRNKVSLYAMPKGFIANLSNNIQFENGLAKKANYMSIITGLNFKHAIDDSWAVNLNGGYQVYSNYSLQSEGRNEIYNFNTSNGVYASVGLKFNLINNKKRKN